MEAPPPYEANNTEKGFTNPVYSISQGYDPSNYSSPPGYPATHSYTTSPGQTIVPMHIPSPGYTSTSGYASTPGYTTSPGNTPSSGYNYTPGSTGQPKPAETVEELSGFGEAAVRRGFIRKVYSILCCQLLVTGGVIASFLFVDQLKEYVQENMWVYWS